MSGGEIALGLMSGTSADGVSAALASFKGHEFKFLGAVHGDYPDDVLAKIRRGPEMSARELSALNVRIGEVFSQAALRLLKKTRTDPSDVACIGSHGQTIYHGPRDTPRNTLQVGDPAVIAERTGITTVSHFRNRDVAAGGEGAPLMPYFDHHFFGGDTVRAMQNIGGIGNVTVVGKGLPVPLAFDTGPGNGLMDAAVRLITDGAENFDAGGLRAKRGKIAMDCVEQMMRHDYFKRPPPKSTGVELFGRDYVVGHVGHLVKDRPDDALATLNYLTCISIQEAYRKFVFPSHKIGEIVVSGGGVHNRVLMKKLECLFAPIPVKTIDDFGVPAQSKEPVAFAFFGLRCLQRKVNHVPSGTGAARACVLGSITPGSPA